MAWRALGLSGQRAQRALKDVGVPEEEIHFGEFEGAFQWLGVLAPASSCQQQKEEAWPR